MNKKIMTISMGHVEADTVTAWGKTVNVYDTYAHAILNGDTGLVPVFAVNRLTGAVASSATTQYGKNTTRSVAAGTKAQAGLEIDEFGKFVFAVDADTYKTVYLNSAAGRQGGPLRVDVNVLQSEEAEESASGE